MNTNDMSRHVMPQPLVITPEVLSGEQRRIADDYVKLAGNHGAVLVGVVMGESEWDVRPMVLENGTVKIFRFSNPNYHFSSVVYAEIADIINRLPNFDGVATLMAGGNSSRIWQLRPYFQQTLAQLAVLQKTTLGITPLELAKELYYIVEFLLSSGVVHGHLSLSNIAVVNGKVSLMDFAFASVEHFGKKYGLAPELIAGKDISVATDVFGLGKIFGELLRNNLNEEQLQLVQAMLDQDPTCRPDMGLIKTVLFANTATFVPKVNTKDEMRLGRVLGENLTVNSEQNSSVVNTNSFRDEVNKLQHAVKTLDTVNLENTGENISTLNSLSQADDVKKEVSELYPNQSLYTPHLKKVDALKSQIGKVKNTNYIVLGIVVILFVLCAKLFFSNSRETYVDIQGASPMVYRDYWNSGLSSKMGGVAVAAVEGDEDAQLIIIKDVLDGNQKFGIAFDLLRLAFDQRWEMELSEYDRETVLRLGLARYLPQDMREELPDFSELHPGVIFAMLVTKNEEQDIKAWSGISSAVLARLPEPYGKTFASLGADIMLSAPEVHAVARILAGDRSLALLKIFLGTVKQASELTKRINLILQNPSKPYSTEQIFSVLSDKWSKESFHWMTTGHAVNWNIKPATVKLGIIIGDLSMSVASLKLEDYADLLKYPNPSVRAQAAMVMLKRFIGKKNQDTIALLSSSQVSLSRRQIVSFVSILALQPKIQFKMYREWFEQNASISVDDILQLLISRGQVKDDSFSIVAVQRLKDSDWKATNETLHKLVFHVDPLVRVLAYAHLDPAEPIQLKILMEALKKEPEPRLRVKLRERLAEVGAA